MFQELNISSGSGFKKNFLFRTPLMKLCCGRLDMESSRHKILFKVIGQMINDSCISIDKIIEELERKDDFGHSALWYICMKGFDQILRSLLYPPANIPKEKRPKLRQSIVESIHKNEEEPGILWISTYYDRFGILQVLLEDVCIPPMFLVKPSMGLTPFTLADIKSSNAKQIFEDLVDFDITSLNTNDNTDDQSFGEDFVFMDEDTNEVLTPVDFNALSKVHPLFNEDLFYAEKEIPISSNTQEITFLYKSLS